MLGEKLNRINVLPFYIRLVYTIRGIRKEATCRMYLAGEESYSSELLAGESLGGLTSRKIASR